jgi:hypothetical protein
MNYFFQASAADVAPKSLLKRSIDDAADAMLYSYAYYGWPLYADVKLFSSLTNAKAPMFYVHTEAGVRQGPGYSTEGEAIADAERRARANPGTPYYVMRMVAKSYQPMQPSITTRL